MVVGQGTVQLIPLVWVVAVYRKEKGAGYGDGKRG